MPKLKSLNPDETRQFALTLEPIAGGLTMFYAFINGTKLIQAEATKKRLWRGNIPTSQVKIKVRVIGIGNAQYKLGIDLPKTADDQILNLNLEGGYHEIEIIL